MYSYLKQFQTSFSTLLHFRCLFRILVKQALPVKMKLYSILDSLQVYKNLLLRINFLDLWIQRHENRRDLSGVLSVKNYSG